jgi:hypothetical protein
MVGCWLWAPLTARAAPPAQPLEFTPEQYQCLSKMADQPDHAETLNLHASYKTERAKRKDINLLIDDTLTVVHDGGYVGLLLTFLIIGLG